MGELPVHAHVGRDLEELGQVEGEAEHEDGHEVDHQPPPAPHPRVQWVADPAVTLNTAGERCNLVDLTLKPTNAKSYLACLYCYPPD